MEKFNYDRNNIFFRCVEDSNEAIMISNKNGILIYVNPAWSKIYGYSFDEAVGRSPKLLHSGFQPPEFYSEMWSRIRNQKIGYFKGELTNRAKSGKYVPVLLTITAFRTDDGLVDGYMGIALDMTEKRELEARIAHQDRLASVGMLASGLAHEIGTPMGVIRGRAEFLMMQSKDVLLSKSLEVIITQIDRISKLIRSLLRVSRSFNDVKVESYEVREVVEEVISLLGQNIRESSIDVRICIPDQLKARFDFNRLEQILINLIMNAHHAIIEGRDRGKQGPHFVNISAMEEQSLVDPLVRKVKLIIEDSGCGIPVENIKKLFKPFFTTKEIGKGTGLGLAITAQLATEMKAEVQVESNLGEGAKFAIILPTT